MRFTGSLLERSSTISNQNPFKVFKTGLDYILNANTDVDEEEEEDEGDGLSPHEQNRNNFKSPLFSEQVSLQKAWRRQVFIYIHNIYQI